MENQKIFSSDKNWIKAYIVDVLPCISIAFFVLAYAYNAAFFSVFDIDILQYATFGDIFISIANPLCITALAYLIIFAFFERANKAYLHLFQINKTAINNNTSSSRWSFLSKIGNTQFIIRFKSFIEKYSISILSIFISITKLVIRVIPSAIVLVLIFLFFAISCADWLFSLLHKYNIVPSLSVATIALIIPVFFIPAAIGFLEGLLIGCDEDIKKNVFNFLNFIKSKIKTVVVIFAISYYLYAILIFAAIGIERGNSLREYNNTSFVIKTSDGTFFDDKCYGYVAHISEKTFLFNKKNYENVILFNDVIAYTKIKKPQDDKIIFNKIFSIINKIKFFARN